MQRRELLATLISISVSGCIGIPESDRGNPPTDSTTSTSTSVVTSGIELPPCPEKPDPLTRNNVKPFTMQFERAYLSRRVIEKKSGEIISIDVSTNDPKAKRLGDGWVVRVTVKGPEYTFRYSETETEHVDPQISTVSYFIDNQTVRRATGGKEVDPRESGRIVQCPPR